MAKLTLSSLLAGFRATNKLNENFDNIEAAIENTLSRDGTAPNAMLAPLDMNSQQILNLPAPTTDNSAVRKIDLDNAVISSGGSGGGGAVDSVNGKTGVVVLVPSDIGAAVAGSGVTSVNGQTGAVTAVASVNGNTGAVTVTPAGIGALATTARGAIDGVASLDSSGLVPSSQLPTSGSYKGTWNATTNVPTIVSGVGVNGDFYKVATAGTTTIDGVSSWAIGDEIRFGSTTWQKIANSAAVSSVAGRTGAVVLGTTDIAGVATARILGRNTAGTGAAEELTGTQLTAMLDLFATASKGLVPAPVTSTGKVLMDDGTWKDPGVKYASSYGVSASNTAAQNATAFAVLSAAGPGTYIFPAGTILLNNTVTISSYQTWKGAGSGITTLKWTSIGTNGGISCGSAASPKTKVAILDMTLDDNNLSTHPDSGVISFNSVVDFVIDGVQIINMYKYGMGIDSCNTGLISNFEIIKNSKTLTQNQAINISNYTDVSAGGTVASANIIVQNGTCRNTAILSIGEDIWFEHVNIYGWSFGAGIVIEVGSNRGGIINCLATDGTGVDSPNSYTAGGFEVWGVGCTVVGVTAIANDGMGIDWGSENGILANSYFANNGRGSTTFSGISARYGGGGVAKASGSLIVGCRALDTGAGTQKYGYTEESSLLANITVKACSFIGNVTGPTNILSASTVTDATGGGVSLATTTPADIGTGAVGTGTTAARSDHVHSHGNQTGGTLHAAATTGANGFMSATDKTKLDGVASGATNTALSSATPASVGVQTAGVASTASRSDHIHDHGNQTAGSHHAAATTSVNGFMSATDKTKLDAISSGAVLGGSFAFAGATIPSGGIGALGVTIAGAALGDFILVGASFPMQNCTLSGFVPATNSVTAVFTNNTGASVTLASGTVKFRVLKL